MSEKDGIDVVIIADGWRKSTFENLLKRGDLEDIQNHYLDDGVILENVISNIPSISIASHASILTGSFQDEHGIPGHRWQSDNCSCCRNYISLGGPIRVNQDLSCDVTTFLEDAPPGSSKIAVQSVIRRGAELQSTLLTQRARPILGRLGGMLAQASPARAVAWLPRVDSLSHFYGPESRVVADEMEKTSRALGRLALDLKNDGLWDNARILIVPDHGHRSVHYHSSMKALLSRIGVTASVNPRRVNSKETIVRTSGDAAAYVYLSEDERRFESEIAESLASLAEVSLCCLRSGDEAFFFTATGRSRAVFGKDGINYHLISGVDPLGILGNFERAKFVDNAPLMGSFPDFLHQYSRSHVSGRSANLLVFSSEDTHFGVAPRMGWRLGFHRGTHGGPSIDEVVVSAIFKGHHRIDGATPVRSADLLKVLDWK